MCNLSKTFTSWQLSKIHGQINKDYSPSGMVLQQEEEIETVKNYATNTSTSENF